MKNNFKVNYWPFFIVFIAFIVYSNTLNHSFVLDDAIVITENEFVKKGIKGIPDIIKNDLFKGFFKENKKLVQAGRYRPLSLIFYAITYEFSGLNSNVYHFINVLFYSLLCLLLYFLLLRILNFNDYCKKENYNNKIIAFVATLIFTVHPIHTEVVANIKGFEEILALLFSILVIFIALDNYKKNLNIFLIALFFFLALLSKENSITLSLILPLTIYIFHNTKIKDIFKVFLVLSIPTIIYISLRYYAIGELNYKPSNELLNNPFIHANNLQKFSTILLILLKYIKLAFLPFPLTIDYYPYHIKLINFGVIPSISLILHILWITWLIRSILRKSNNYIEKILIIISIIWLTNIFLVSNTFINIGTFMNERFLFFPSISISLLLIAIIIKFYKTKNIIYAILTLISLIFIILTIDRNRYWKDNYTLFTHDVKISSNSAKINCMAGGILYEKSFEVKDTLTKLNYLKKSLKHINKAIQIHPSYVDALRLKGNIYTILKNYDSATYYYLKALKIFKNDPYTWQNSEILLNLIPDNKHKLLFALQLLDIDSLRFYPNYICGNIYGKIFNNIHLSIKYLTKAYKINPNSYETCKDLGVAYGLLKKYDQSEKWLKKAIEKNPTDYDSYYNLALTYYFWGKKNKYDSLILLINNVKNRK